MPATLNTIADAFVQSNKQVTQITKLKIKRKLKISAVVRSIPPDPQSYENVASESAADINTGSEESVSVLA